MTMSPASSFWVYVNKEIEGHWEHLLREWLRWRGAGFGMNRTGPGTEPCLDPSSLTIAARGTGYAYVCVRWRGQHEPSI